MMSLLLMYLFYKGAWMKYNCLLINTFNLLISSEKNTKSYKEIISFDLDLTI